MAAKLEQESETVKRKTSDDGLTDDEYLSIVWPRPWQTVCITAILGCFVGLLFAIL